MTSLTIQFPPTAFPAGGGTVAFPAVSISADLIAQLLGFADAASLHATVAAAATTTTNAYPLAVPATPNAANVSVGQGSDRIDLYVSNNPTGTPCTFSVAVTQAGGEPVVVTAPFAVTSNVGESQGQAQCLTILGAWGVNPTIEVIPEGGGINQIWCWCDYNYLPFEANTDATNSRGTGTPNYGAEVFDSNGGSITFLPPSAIPTAAIAAPPPALTNVAGATINGAASPPGTLVELIGNVVAGETLTLPAGTIVGTATVPNACTILGGGATISAAGLTPIYDKAVFVPLVSGTVLAHMTLTGAAISASQGMNAAGARGNVAGIDLTLDTVEITGNQNGILTTGNLTMTACNVHDNGAAALANGQSAVHEVYSSGDATMTTTISTSTISTGALATHALKSRTGNTVVSGATLTAGAADGGAVSGSVIDIPDGGLFTMTGGTIALRPGAANTLFLGYGMESANNASDGVAVKLSGVVFDGGGVAGEIQNGTNIPTATLELDGCTYAGTAGPPTISGFASVVGTIAASS